MLRIPQEDWITLHIETGVYILLLRIAEKILVSLNSQ